ncbi:hypothetical protein GHT06_018213 [Daphnia sinensis]|uniref:Uncharacterized protein n=1 Tax=Daphnia sinensis TaxID=1820382 RepID=A0AAD5L4S8_9CRUS|nr:hypothetical protein GHT06_018213 [Daphnia sinensis]
MKMKSLQPIKEKTPLTWRKAAVPFATTIGEDGNQRLQSKTVTVFILRSYHSDNKDNIWTSIQALDVRQNDAHGDNNNKTKR